MSRIEKKQEMTQAIVNTAKQLFEEHGIENVSMHAIAKELNIGQGTLYRRFSNKGELCFAMLESDFLRLHQKIMTYMNDNKEATSYDKGVFIIRALVSLISSHSSWLEVMLTHIDGNLVNNNQVPNSPPPPIVIVQELIQPIFEQVDTDVDTFFWSTTIAAVLNPLLIRQLTVSGYTEDDIVDGLATIFLAPLL
ncbi:MULTISPECIES: TetR/AcrR family transcriptional regulator [Listeria]|uniref:TetR/AcrR family transcriptional regulator n=2 Tax=Listeria TaxID=1637 RepID=A0A841ZHT8_9LIST|nr:MULTISPECIES: TetR/AcrR family transcriptional regulator [Listeria]EUJ46563.1 TetR family transcriptional regulator [Listeria riparia FSL S10-1204]MBC1402729.1 TetR/AcrR family transcriptional regulator [Listeria booriae]MBC1513664.1 TetR/AcrR family transcriptional regulator [Listeria booriae]MBC1617757.1 TetR/AcrR family transcriptional regulator [Listeria booriae]MBC1651224.1 TetR/AcrR family transcriptional regulator [Listeria booriae]